jgi:hypothetical protein
LNQAKNGVWCAVSRRRATGPIFFEKRYQDIAMQFDDLLEADERGSWF